MSDSESEQYDLLDQLADEFAARFRRGERPALEEYTDRYPELAADIRELFPAMVEVEYAEGLRQVDDEIAISRIANLPLNQIGDYRILRTIGRGGMGVVYEAEQISLGRRVALKVLPGHVSSDPMVQERFRREARAAARLHHTNIVPVFEVGQDRDVRFYAMQLIQGQGLDLVIAELRRLRDRAGSEPKSKTAFEGESLRPGKERLRQGIDEPTPDEGVTVSRLVRSILTAQFDSAGQLKELVEVAQSTRARTGIGSLATPAVTGTNTRVAEAELALTRTETGGETEGDTTGPIPPGPLAPGLSRSASPSSSSVILPGGTQLSSVESGRRAFFRSLAQIGRQVAGGLAYAHARGIVHRDIKPSNLLLDTEGVVWITDFGLAKGDDEGLTQSGDIVGTIRYMAPERFRGEADARADVYALGLTLYELLTLRLCYDSTDRFELIEQIKSQEPQRPRTVDQRIPRDLETIVLKAIEKDAAARYQSAEAMGEDLRRFLADEPIRARQVSASERFSRWARRNPAIAVLGGVLTGVLALGTLVSTFFAVRANQHADEAYANARQATREMRRANLEANKAIEQAARADKEAQHARDEKLISDSRLYRLEMALARQAWLGGQAGLARQHLHAVEPNRPGDTDFRRFDWYYLQQLCHADLRTLAGHSGSVAGVAFSPDGRQLASAGADKSVRLWDTVTGQELRRLLGHTAEVRCVTFSADGRQLASASYDQSVRLWDVATGQAVRTLRGHSGQVRWVSFSPDGRQLASASGSPDRTVRVWDLATGQARLSLRGRTAGFTGVAYRPDGHQIATAGSDGAVGLWDAATGRLDRFLLGHQGQAFGVAYSPDGHAIASAGFDATVRLWDAATGHELRTLNGHAGPVQAVAFAPDGSRIASAGWDHMVKLWEVDSGRDIVTLRGHSSTVVGVAFAPNSLRIASASDDQTVKLWDAAADTVGRTLTGHFKQVDSVAFSPDGRGLASASDDRTIKVYDAATGLSVRTLRGHAGKIWDVAYSPDGRLIVSGSHDQTVKLWDVATGQEVRTLRGHTDQVWGVAYSPTGQQIASVGVDQTVRLWDAATGKELFTLRGHENLVLGVAFSPDGRTLASGSWDGTVKLWEITTGREVRALRGHANAVGGVAFSPDGRHVASASWDNTVKLWETDTGREGLTLRGHTAPVIRVAFSPDGHTLASASWDHDVKLWDIAKGEELLTLSGHRSQVVGVAFSPDGQRIASCSWDYTVRLWEAIPLTSEHRELREAQGVVEFFFARSLPTTAVLDLIRCDATLSEPVRKRALALAEPFGQNLGALEAERRVELLYEKPLLRSQVRESLRSDSSLSEPSRRRALALAEQIAENPERLNTASWAVVRHPGADPAAYQQALRQAEAACRLIPDSSSYLSTLGLAQYRAGNNIDAAATLERADELNHATDHGSSVPRDLAFLALARHRLGRTDAALATLARLRRFMKAGEWAQDQEAQAFLREAETIDLDLVFPTDPFAR